MLVRLVILLIAPPVLIYTIISRILSGFFSSLKYAWWDCQDEMGALRHSWKNKSIHPEDWK